MRTRILVTVLAVLGALGILLWKPSVPAMEVAAPGAVEVSAEAEPAELVAAPAVGEESARESVTPDAPASEPESALERIPAVRDEDLESTPDDPVEQGACTLLLKLADAETGVAQQGVVQLWRLGAPGNDDWGAGDQLQARAKVLSKGRDFPGLPQGTYRAVSFGAAVGSGYTDAFQVGGALTEHTLLIQAPRKIETYVEIYDASGRRLEEIEVKRDGDSWRSTKQEDPPWVVEREPAREYWDLTLRGGGGGGGFGYRSHQSWKPLRAGSRGFELGEFPQNSRDSHHTYNFELRVADGRVLDLAIKTLPEHGGRLVAVFMGESEVMRHVVLPDGRNGVEAELSGTVKSHPVPVDDNHPHATWRDASIEVTIFRESNRSWKRVWTPSEGPMTDRWVEPEEH